MPTFASPCELVPMQSATHDITRYGGSHAGSADAVLLRSDLLPLHPADPCSAARIYSVHPALAGQEAGRWIAPTKRLQGQVSEDSGSPQEPGVGPALSLSLFETQQTVPQLVVWRIVTQPDEEETTDVLAYLSGNDEFGDSQINGEGFGTLIEEYFL